LPRAADHLLDHYEVAAGDAATTLRQFVGQSGGLMVNRGDPRVGSGSPRIDAKPKDNFEIFPPQKK
jgi:hypothetical protein